MESLRWSRFVDVEIEFKIEVASWSVAFGLRIWPKFEAVVTRNLLSCGTAAALVTYSSPRLLPLEEPAS